MEKFEKQLRLDIEIAIKFKITSTTDAKALYYFLIENDETEISLSTIRRFWGLVPKRKPNKKTLNSLSVFLGYKSFFDFVKAKNRFEYIEDDVKIQEIKLKSKLTKADFNFIAELTHKVNYNTFVVALFEYALFFEKWDYIKQLFDDNQNRLLATKEKRNQYSAVLAYHIFILLNGVPLNYFNKIIKNLITIGGFKTYIIYRYIDIINLNYRYGKILERISKTSVNTEETIFLNLITNLKIYFNGETPKLYEIKAESLENLPEVLLGRYYGYQILCSRILNLTEKETYYWNAFNDNITSKTYLAYYSQEFIHHLLFAKCFKKLEIITTKYYEQILDDYHEQSHLDVFILNILEIIFSYQSKDFKRGKRIFLNLNVEKIKFNSYRGFYLIFYHIVGYHVNDKTTLKTHHKSAYFKIVRAAKFKIFDKQYLENFLTEE
tara:strand:- start:83 stop:1390 length:1308 start_codon:yes stop_codon:yes gene_type:complete